jgi:hypothetical protein
MQPIEEREHLIEPQEDIYVACICSSFDSGRVENWKNSSLTGSAMSGRDMNPKKRFQEVEYVFSREPSLRFCKTSARRSDVISCEGTLYFCTQ